jgi:hypothetical protein
LNRHAFDPVSFLAGAVLTAVGVAILTEGLTLLEANAGWLVPVFAVAFGAAVLLSTPRAGRDRSPAEPAEEAPPEQDEGPDAASTFSTAVSPNDERL